jgi:hypothetical protein
VVYKLIKKKEEPIEEEKPALDEMMMEEPVDIVDEITGAEEISDFAKVVERLLSSEDIELKTELSQNQINAISILTTFAEMYDVISIKKLILTFLKLQVSKKRKSRREIVELMRSKFAEQDEVKDLLRSLK